MLSLRGVSRALVMSLRGVSRALVMSSRHLIRTGSVVSSTSIMEEDSLRILSAGALCSLSTPWSPGDEEPGTDPPSPAPDPESRESSSVALTLLLFWPGLEAELLLRLTDDGDLD